MDPIENRPRREGGSALIVAVMMIAMMGLIGFASLDTVMRDRQVAGNTSLSQHAFYAADAGIAASLEVLRNANFVVTPQITDCLSTPVPSATLANNASYGPDPTAPAPSDPSAPNPGAICLVGWGEPCAGSSLDAGYFHSIWSIRTEGRAPGGALARVQATALRCLVR